MEGAEVLALQHQLAAKNLVAPPDSPVIPDPKGGPPQLEPPQEPDL